MQDYKLIGFTSKSVLYRECTPRHLLMQSRTDLRFLNYYRKDLCDMVGVDKTTYLEFLNNPIIPSISEVEKLLQECADNHILHNNRLSGCSPMNTENSQPFVLLPESSLSPPYNHYMDPQCQEDDPSFWHHSDLTTLLPPQNDFTPEVPDVIKLCDVKSEVTWSNDVSNHGYDSSGSIESPHSTGSLESEETETGYQSDCRLPTAVENMDDVAIMTSHLEETSSIPGFNDEDFSAVFEIDEEKAFKKRRKGLHLWEFLLEVLDDERYVPHLLYWVDRSRGIFKIEKSQEVAKLWGRRKQRSHMTYEHMSRAMRHYYSSGIMRRIPGKRLMYQFGPRAFATRKTS